MVQVYLFAPHGSSQDIKTQKSMTFESHAFFFVLVSELVQPFGMILTSCD